MKKILLLATATFIQSSIFSHAGAPLGGLTVAVSQDGEKIVAAGDTRTLFVLDPATLEVQKREWIEVSITGLAFSKSGDVLAVQETGDEVILFSTEDWTKKAEISRRGAWTTSSEADTMAGVDGSTIYINSMSDGAEVGKIALPEGLRAAALALNPAGTKLALLEQGKPDESEPKVSYSDIPKDLKGVEREEFEQKNDGKTSRLFLFNTASGEKEKEIPMFYSTRSGSQLSFEGDALVVVSYDNTNAKISPDGKVEIFQLPNSFNYGIGKSPAGDLLMTGGLRNYSITKTSALTSVKGEADKLPSWPEYWKGFAATAEGSKIYGATTGYRVFQFDPSGKVVVSAPMK